ncbi:MAG TPA: hypothetical protein VES95_01455 [Dermatophilaceae bacterium]|nr:hypothetical protein [Dermatophilaceae bacterium]
MVPALAGPGATRGRGVLVGVVARLAAAAIGLLVFFLLLSGLDGA